MDHNNNNQYIRKSVKDLFGPMADVNTAALRAYDQAYSYGYSLFGIEHLMAELVPMDLFAKRIMSSGGSPALLQREIYKSFRTHRASCGPIDVVTQIHPDIIDISNAMLEEMETYPGRAKDELLNLLIDHVLLKIDGSACAEQAIIFCGARRLLSEPEGNASTIDDDINDIFSIGDLIDEEVGGAEPQAPTAFDQGGSEQAATEGASRPADMSYSDFKDKYSKQQGGAGKDSKSSSSSGAAKTAQAGKKEKDPLEGFLRNLTEEAKAGLIDAVVGRDKEIDHVISCLKRRRKGSVLLFGEAGIGKTAIAEGVALRLSEGGEGILTGRPLYELSIGSMVAGTRYRGDFEERISLLLTKMKEERAILFIDEIHMLVGAGAGSESPMGASNLFKPALARGELTIIGATTSREVRAIRKDGAMMRRFEPIMVREPTQEETLHILKGSVEPYLEHHQLSLGAGVLEAICEITSRYQPERRFPDKAFDLLDSACVVASEMVLSEEDLEEDTCLLVSHVETAADRAKIRRPHMPQPELLDRARVVDILLSDRVHGQEAAIAEFSGRVREAIFDLKPDGMRSCCLLAGPDVTAKSELVKSFAKHMRMQVTVLDGQSLSGPDAHIILLGSGLPGESSGILTEAADRDPEMVFHLTNPRDLSLQAQRVLDEMMRTGVVRNAEGRYLSFRSSWLIASVTYDPEKRVASFGFGQTNEGADQAIIEKEVPKVLMDHFGSPIVMRKATNSALRELVLQTVEEVEDSLRPMGLRLRISDALVAQIIEADGKSRSVPEMTRATILPMIARHLVDDASQTNLSLDVVKA